MRMSAKALMLVVITLLTVGNCYAQDKAALAHQYAADKDYDKAIGLYKELYAQTPGDIYKDYRDVLLQAKKYKDAEKLVAAQQQQTPQNGALLIDLGHIYDLEGKDKKAAEQFELAHQRVNGDDVLTQQLAGAFLAIGKPDDAAEIYRRAGQVLGNPIVYSAAIADVYMKAGNLEKAVGVLLDGSGVYANTDNVKAMLLQLLGNDPEKLRQVQRALVKKINEQPGNIYYAELLTWIYTQKNDWDGALLQIEAIDERNKENGRRLVDFARLAANAKQYDVAAKAYDEVIAKGPEQQFYVMAQSEKLSASFRQLKNNPAYKPEEVATLAAQYDTFLAHTPSYYATETALDFAALEAQYGNNAQKAITVLQDAIERPDAQRKFMGRAKLQLGDYYILAGRVWDASLIYSQVDKEFKEDPLGEDARLRNAKLAYYRSDFPWAQRQLSVLKASTSELIANDALYLSVLITENTEADSNIVPLTRFAHADLLLFQNKDKEAQLVLDSIVAEYPKHALNDDVLMLRAKIEDKHRDYTKELAYLKVILDKYADDVLGDDAEFKTADIYENNLHDPAKAKHYYEQLIIDYPGSTYVQAARQRLQQIDHPALP